MRFGPRNDLLTLFAIQLIRFPNCPALHPRPVIRGDGFRALDSIPTVGKAAKLPAVKFCHTNRQAEMVQISASLMRVNRW